MCENVKIVDIKMKTWSEQQSILPVLPQKIPRHDNCAQDQIGEKNVLAEIRMLNIL